MDQERITDDTVSESKVVLKNMLDAWNRAIVSNNLENIPIELRHARDTHDVNGEGYRILNSCCRMLEFSMKRNVSLVHVLYDDMLARSGIEGPADDADSDAGSDDDFENVGDRNDSDEQQDAGQHEKWTFKNTYKLVKVTLTKMDSEAGREAFCVNEPLSPRKDDWVSVVRCAARLWMLDMLKKCKSVGATEDFTEEAGRLYTEYKAAADRLDEGSPTMELLLQLDCFDIVDALLKLGKNGEQFRKDMDKAEFYKETCKTPMSMEMIIRVRPHCNKYVIPRTGPKTRGYGFFVSGAEVTTGFDPSKPEQSQIISEREKKSSVEGLEAAGLYNKKHSDALYKTLHPNNKWDIRKLNDEVKSTLGIIGTQTPKCSVLVFVLSCHGFHKEICGADKPEGKGTHQPIIEFLKAININSLRGVPKVVMIQCCQDFLKQTDSSTVVHELNNEKNENLRDIFLIITTAPGVTHDRTPQSNFSKFFSDQLKKLDGKTPICDVLDEALANQSGEIGYYEKQLRPACKQIILPPSAGSSQPAEDSTES